MRLQSVHSGVEPSRQFLKKYVNDILLRRYGDYAALRCYLVEMGLLVRENNVYWCCGGSGLDGAIDAVSER
ncbi:DUF2087 domain-containing protein [Austwickia sp. TVS 96-490-7B]|uniref:DUF2087 domain-containing protein n=1 Tax=Austwickia sp. TVS 96-490-7B TaxID=2830843 RepID=UPI00351D002D